MKPPESSVLLWVRDNQIFMQIPSTVLGGTAHTLTFTDDLAGRARVFAILRERSHVVGKVATKSAPTQRQVLDYDKAKVRRVTKPKPDIAPGVALAAREVLRKLGMI